MMLPPQRMRVGEVIEPRKDFKSQVILPMIENLQLGSSAPYKLDWPASYFGNAGMCSIDNLDILLGIRGYNF